MFLGCDFIVVIRASERAVSYRSADSCCTPFAADQENVAPAENKIPSRGRGIAYIPGMTLRAS